MNLPFAMALDDRKPQSFAKYPTSATYNSTKQISSLISLETGLAAATSSGTTTSPVENTGDD